MNPKPKGLKMLTETIEKIKESIKPHIDEWKNARYEFIKKLEVYCRSTVYKDAEESGKRRDAYLIHDLKTKKGYTKSMERYFGRSEADLRELIDKDAEAKMFTIERAAYKKLKGVEVKTVENYYYGDAAAKWLINEEKMFGYEVIFAGGYNIQCLHIRVLFSYK